jgi:hypothetical protein
LAADDRTPFAAAKNDSVSMAKFMKLPGFFYSSRLGALEMPNRIVMTPPMRMRVESNSFKDDENSNRNKFAGNDEKHRHRR